MHYLLVENEAELAAVKRSMAYAIRGQAPLEDIKMLNAVLARFDDPASVVPVQASATSVTANAAVAGNAISARVSLHLFEDGTLDARCDNPGVRVLFIENDSDEEAFKERAMATHSALPMMADRSWSHVRSAPTKDRS